MTAAVAVIALPFALGQAVIGKALGVPDPFILTALGIVTTALIHRPIERALVDITDKYLFQRKNEIKVILKNLSEKVLTILDLNQIGRTILGALEETLRLESGAILIEAVNAGHCRPLHHFGLGAESLRGSLRTLAGRPEIFAGLFGGGKNLNLDCGDKKEAVAGGVREWMDAAKFRVAIPLEIDDARSAVLLLGKKKSDQEYTQEEMDYFPAIASQVSLAMRNACLIESVIKEREAKLQAEHVAERVKFARTIKHEVKNSLAGSIEGPAQLLSMYHVGDLKKAFKERDEEWFLEVCDKVKGVAEKILKGVDKVHDIAETSLGGLDKKDETLRRVYFKIIWDEAKEEVRLGRDCRYESEIPDGFVVYGVYSALHRVFVNLITNACDAMNGRAQKLIKLRCACREIAGRQVAYFEFEDNGPGIPESIRDRIFEQGFSTKPKPSSADFLASGSGQGLYACKTYIEKIHRGKLWVDNSPDGGAIFKFWIPMTGQA